MNSMKAKEIVFTDIIECPVPGCKRGFLTGCVTHGGKVLCPEHHCEMAEVFKDAKGNKYHYVWKFAKEGKING